ncbi:general secretion pathway protein [Nitrosococcus halophilus Nc 4]|uniref:General secretion pathway protein n=1 Tax=Nitrosococcus halophilus (strain Nc4) TaxID=472759 RepID=D5C285_NITHN|nr:type II secretion system protein GspM [Nitrosococcus halophilus]ADE16673.1 general secretion pathway protein [Nitrosococcus halophilus Nc 4]
MNLQLSKKWHCATAVGLLLFVLLMAYFVLVQPVIAKHRFYQENIASMQQRLQKYNQIIASRTALEAELNRLRREQAANAYYLEQQSAPLAATELRKRVKTVVESSDGVLVSTQSLPLVENEPFPRVGISVRMTGDTEVLQKVLYDLESRRPLLFVDDLQVRSRQIRRRSRHDRRTIIEETQLTISFELYGYMRGSGAFSGA